MPLPNKDRSIHPLFAYHKDLLSNITGVIQVGAHIGQEVKYWCEAKIPNQLYFEPHAESFAKLQREMGPAKDYRVDMFPIALSDKDGTATWYESDEGTMSSLLPCGTFHKVWPDGVKCRKTEITTKRLDTFFYEHSSLIPHPSSFSLLFIDAQGADDLVVRGAEQFIRNHAKIVVAEVQRKKVYDGGMADEFDALMRSFGFELYADYWLDDFEAQVDVIYRRITA